MTYEDEVEIKRDSIDRLDKEILKKIASRVKIAKKIGKIKEKYRKPILDRTREKQIMKKLRDFAVNEGLDPKRAEAIFREIMILCKDEE